MRRGEGTGVISGTGGEIPTNETPKKTINILSNNEKTKHLRTPKRKSQLHLFRIPYRKGKRKGERKGTEQWVGGKGQRNEHNKRKRLKPKP